MTRINTLIIKQRKGVITPEERMELDAFAAQSEDNKRLVEDYSKYSHVLKEIKLSNEWRTEEAWQRVKKGLPRKAVRIKKPYLAVAAATLIILGAGWLLWNKKPDKIPTVAKLDHSQQASGVNTLKTGKGESRSLQLSDGSSILLNSASSVQYPGSFSGPERAVTLLEGEVHCEIAKDPARPFRMRIQGMDVVVKGTKFDVSAYKDDSLVRTTLIEGKITLKAGNDTLSLRPGEQAIWAPGKKLKKIPVDSVEARARSQGWKENKFKWVNADLKTVLNDIAHWYGYKVVYNKEVFKDPYDVTIVRSQTINDVLKKITGYSGVKFKVDSTTITAYR
jgi:ferric-dicitrate binding protein FerR (iron transport regulator)